MLLILFQFLMMNLNKAEAANSTGLTNILPAENENFSSLFSDGKDAFSYVTMPSEGSNNGESNLINDSVGN